MKYKIVFWIYFTAGYFTFLTASEPDSLWHIAIDELSIEQSREKFFSEDKKILRPDSIQTRNYRNASIGHIISSIAPVYVNMYGGNGSASSVLLRGGNSSQTTVMWNGFPLNSLTTGSADLSLLPVNGFNDISLTFSAAGSLYSSGSFGGSIDLNNIPDWGERINVTINPEIGSFGDKRLSFNASGGNQTVQFNTSITRQQADNNFAFIDSYKFGNPKIEIEHNAFFNTNFIQNIFLNLPSNNLVEAGFWVQSKRKEIPAIMGSYMPGSAVQGDSTFKIYAKWNKLFRNSSLNFKSAWFSNNLIYRDNFSQSAYAYLIDSRIESSRLMGDLFYRIFLGSFISLDAGAGLSALSAKVSNYGGNVNELIPSFYAGFKYRQKLITLNLSLRKEFHRNIVFPPLISAGLRAEIVPRLLAIRANYSGQFRRPTFNDKYWIPGGNTGLLPEKGWSYDAGLELTSNNSKNTKLAIDASAFVSNINNLIQWLPDDGGTFWFPKNTKSARSHGFETRFRYNHVFKNYNVNLNLAYSLLKSTISDSYNNEESLIGNELIYRPNHQFRFYTSIEFRSLSLAGNFSYTGKRYTTEDNNPVHAMPPHAVFNFYSAYQVRFKDISVSLLFRVQNLLNAQYQFVRSYPMPGRSFHLSLIFNFQNLLN